MSFLAILVTSLILQTPTGENLVDNGHFVRGHEGWSALWTREEKAGFAATGTEADGRPSLVVQYNGAKDWAYQQTARVPAKAGEIYRIGALASCAGTGRGGVSTVVRDASDNVIEWTYGGVYTTGTHDWAKISRRFVVPKEAASLQFRFEGYGAGLFHFRDAELAKVGTLASARGDVQEPVQIEDGGLRLTIRTDGGIDLEKEGHAWRTVAPESVLLKVTPSAKSVSAVYWDVANDQKWTVSYEVVDHGTEVTVAVDGSGAIQDPVALPGAFQTQAGQWLILPLQEGILYPVDESDLPPMTLNAYGGLTMPWYGCMDPKSGAGLLSIFETPDDAAVRMDRADGGFLHLQPQWVASRGQLRYRRGFRLVPLATGGYGAMAARYRRYAKDKGLVVTLAEKRKRTEAVDRLVGAMNVWTWTNSKVPLCKEMKSMGIDRVLWSGGGTSQEIRAINDLGYLSSRYDIYQDVYDPRIAFSWMNTAGWPDDLVLLEDGSWMHGWAHPDKQPDGSIHWIQGGVINSGRGLARAKQVIPAELATIPYLCRFLDTTTASPWREDYSPVHPLTRSEDRTNKMALLAYCSQTLGLVVGSETGIDASVPYLHYFEGMMSLGPYRLPNAGTDMQSYEKPTADFLKFQVGPKYRLPLWELVYHDCTVSQWYWGDATNKAPEVWDQRDLYDILYGAAPLVMFDDASWQTQKDRILQTYRNACAWTRKIGYDQMVSHEFLNGDHTLQRSRWSSGHWCVVNFADHAVDFEGTTLPAHGFQLH